MKKELKTSNNIQEPKPDIISSKKIPNASEYIAKLKELGLEQHIEAYKTVIEIAKAIQKEKGKALLVGGCVRDMILGKISKDFDIEVYKSEALKLEKIVKQFGKVSDIGKAFGILKMSFGQNIDIDISLPRTDSKIGVGHRGFEIKTDPDMSIEEAARRRDFTINSMAADPLTGKLYDPFNGVNDLKNKCLKVTDKERFKDDPLRVMRALQFIGRFDLKIEPKTVKIIQEMIPKLNELPKERIFEEWKKLLLKSRKPSLGLNKAMKLGVLDQIHPEFPPLKNTKQEQEWHPEGDVWKHTLMSVDAASKIVRLRNLDAKKSLTIILSTLCHDLGKISTTEKKDGRYISHKHEQAGAKPTKKFLSSIGVDNLIRNKVIKLITNHLSPTMLHQGKEKITDKAIRRLAKRIYPATIYELVLLAEADHLGRGPFTESKKTDQLIMKIFHAGPWLLKRARELDVEESRPPDLIQGRDLINIGYKPGVNFGKMIKLANQLRDDLGFTKNMIFESLKEIKNSEKAVEKLKNTLVSKQGIK